MDNRSNDPNERNGGEQPPRDYFDGIETCDIRDGVCVVVVWSKGIVGSSPNPHDVIQVPFVSLGAFYRAFRAGKVIMGENLILGDLTLPANVAEVKGRVQIIFSEKAVDLVTECFYKLKDGDV